MVIFHSYVSLPEGTLFPLPFLVDNLGLYPASTSTGEQKSGPLSRFHDVPRFHHADSGLHVVGAVLGDDFVQASGPVRPGLPPVGGDGTMANIWGSKSVVPIFQDEILHFVSLNDIE